MNRLSIADAARVLGVSVQAIHGKIKRGTLQHETGDDGLTYVYIEEPTDRDDIENGVVKDLYNAYIDALKSENESLKRDQEERREEARRKDTIIAQLNQTLQATINRLPELEAQPETTPEPTDSTVSHAKGENRGDIPPEPQKGFWRRLFAS